MVKQLAKKWHPWKKGKNERSENDSRIFQIGPMLDHIKKNWVEVKSITKKISGIQTRNLEF